MEAIVPWIILMASLQASAQILPFPYNPSLSNRGNDMDSYTFEGMASYLSKKPSPTTITTTTSVTRKAPLPNKSRDDLHMHRFLNGTTKNVHLLRTKADALHFHNNIGRVAVADDTEDSFDLHVDFPEQFEEDWEHLLMWQENIEREGKMHKVLHIHLPSASSRNTSKHHGPFYLKWVNQTHLPESRINQSHVELKIPYFDKVFNKTLDPKKVMNKTMILNLDFPEGLESTLRGFELHLNGKPTKLITNFEDAEAEPNVTEEDSTTASATLIYQTKESVTGTTPPETTVWSTTSMETTSTGPYTNQDQITTVTTETTFISTTGISSVTTEPSTTTYSYEDTMSTVTVVPKPITKKERRQHASQHFNLRLLHNVFPLNDTKALKKVNFTLSSNQHFHGSTAWPRKNYIFGKWFLVVGGKTKSLGVSDRSRAVGLLGSCDLPDKKIPIPLTETMSTTIKNTLIICGGLLKTGTPSPSCYIYSEGKWKSQIIPDIPSLSRGSLTSIRTKLYLTGGHYEETSQASDKVLVFELDKWNNWKEGTSLQRAREGACSLAWKGLLFVLGGGGPGKQIYSDMEFYDTNGGWKWKSLPWKMNHKRKYHGCASAGNSLYVVGGTGSTEAARTIEVIDLKQKIGWKLLTRIHSPRNFFPQVGIIKHDMFIFHGKMHASNSFEIIDLKTKSWLKRKAPNALMGASLFTMAKEQDFLYDCKKLERAH